MLAICEACGTKYNISSSDIGDAGRKVRCTYCDNVWVQMPHLKTNSEISNNVDVDDFLYKMYSTENAAASDKASQHKTSCMTYVMHSFLATILFCFILFFASNDIFRDKIPSALRPVYAIFGIYDTHLLEIENVFIEFQGEGMLYYARVINKSNEAKNVPGLTLMIFDKDHNLLYQEYVTPKMNTMIDIGGSHDIKTKVLNLNEDALYIKTYIGNSIELSK